MIGTTYGGDGQATFAVPDFRGRVPIHTGTGLGLSNYQMGETGGSESVTLTIQQIPQHSHSFGGTSTAATSTDPTGRAFASSSVDVYAPPTAPVQMSKKTTAGGGSQPHSNFMPYACITFVISRFGVFPSQT